MALRKVLCGRNALCIERDGRIIATVYSSSTTNHIMLDKQWRTFDQLYEKLSQMTEEELDEYEMTRLL